MQLKPEWRRSWPKKQKLRGGRRESLRVPEAEGRCSDSWSPGLRKIKKKKKRKGREKICFGFFSNTEHCFSNNNLKNVQ